MCKRKICSQDIDTAQNPFTLKCVWWDVKPCSNQPTLRRTLISGCFCYSIKPTTLAQKTGAIDSTPDSAACVCVIPSGVKHSLAPVSGVEQKPLYFCAGNQQLLTSAWPFSQTTVLVSSLTCGRTLMENPPRL